MRERTRERQSYEGIGVGEMRKLGQKKPPATQISSGLEKFMAGAT